MIFYLLVLLKTCCGTFSLLNVDQSAMLQDTSPHTYRKMADFIIDSREKWAYLEGRNCFIGESGRVPLVELRDFCFLPSPQQVAKIQRQFILMGPFYDWHHVNFGPLTEFDHPSGANIFESRVTNKIAKCADATLGWIWNLADSPSLMWWITHQQVSTQLRHDKIRVMPIGFGYEGWKISKSGDIYIEKWRRDLVRRLQKSKSVHRSTLVLKSFTIHTNLFGDKGDDPRSVVTKELDSIPSLRDIPMQSFETDIQFSDALRQSKFVLSPWGWGPDCFRHYEAIAHGTIPIVMEEWTTDQTLEGLPHLRVKSWSDLNQSMLETEYELIHSREYNLNQLTRNHWLAKLFQRQSNASQHC